jgi:miniconductance mechanosensitive channel
LNDSELENLKKIDLITAYIDSLTAEINKHNIDRGTDKSIAINGRNMTNMGLFRKYIMQYLSNHPAINQEMLLMCRQLQSTVNGVPLEIYAFTSDKRWESYELVMSDIFDHIIASVPYFGLEVFELPSKVSIVNS